MTIVPISLPTVDRVATDGVFPGTLRNLDSLGYKPTDPKTSLVCLPYQHLYFGFAVAVQLETLDFGSLTVSIHQIDMLNKWILLTGNLLTWQSFIKTGLATNSTHTQRDLCTQIYRVFRSAGLSAPWQDFTMDETSDGTITMR